MQEVTIGLKRNVAIIGVVISVATAVHQQSFEITAILSMDTQCLFVVCGYGIDMLLKFLRIQN